MSGNCWLHDHEGVVDAWGLLVLAAIPLRSRRRTARPEPPVTSGGSTGLSAGTLFPGA